MFGKILRTRKFKRALGALGLAAIAAGSSCVKYQTDYSRTGEPLYVYTDDDVVMLDGIKVRDSVVVRSNVAWEIADNDSPQWLEPTVPSPNGSDATLWMKLEPNTTGVSRKATVTVRAIGADYTSAFVFMQKAPAAPFAVTEELEDKIKVDGNIWFMKAGGGIPFLFSSNAECTISSDESWCRVISVISSAYSGGDLALGVGARQMLMIQVDDNTSGDIRLAHITVATTSGGKELLSYSIFQVQTDDTNIPILTVANNDKGNIANWTAVAGVTDYKLNIYDKDLNLLGMIDCGNALSYDISDFAGVTGNSTYVGDLILNVNANGASSNNYPTNSHFASGGGASAADPFTLSCRRHIDNINKVLSMPGYTYSYYKLAANINYAGAAFTPVGPALSSAFVGDFDGGGYTISNSTKTLAVTDMAYALVGCLANPAGGTLTSKVHNLNFDSCGATFPSTPSANFLSTTDVYAVANCVANNYGGEVSYINATNPSISFYPAMGNATNFIHMAAIVGHNGADAAFTGVVDHCYTTGGLLGWTSVNPYSGNNNNNNWYTAGIVAMNDPYCTVSDCGNNSTTVNGRYVGAGVVGYNYGTVSHCYNRGSVSGSVIIGGVVGGKSLTTNTTTAPWPATIEYCWNEGYLFFSPGNTVAVWGGVAGGEIGGAPRAIPATLRASNPADPSGNVGTIMRSCYNNGSLSFDASSDNPGTATVSRQSGIGSLVGQVYSCDISDCYNTGRLYVIINATNVSGNVSPTKVGGLVGCFNGVAGLTSTASMTRCYQAGSLEWASPFPQFCLIGIVAGQRFDITLASITGTFYLNTLQAPTTNTVSTANSALGDGKAIGQANGIAAASDTQLSNQSTFTIWDFSTTWVMGTGTGVNAYPKLRGTNGN